MYIGGKYRVQNSDGSVSGGPMYYIEKALVNNEMVSYSLQPWLLCSFLVVMPYANHRADTMKATFSIPGWVTGLATASVVGFVIVGGIKRIGRVTASLMPIMALIYVLGALIILLLNVEKVLPAFGTIIEYAFNPRAGAFGVGSGLFLTTLIWGIKRGLFSNEAGQGSAPIAHGAAKTKEPVREGVVALLEPFIDTLVVCTMTGLVIVSKSMGTKHPTVFTNAFEASFEIDDDSNILTYQTVFQLMVTFFETIIRSENFTDPDREELFSGQIVLQEDGAVTIQTLTGEAR